MKVTIQDSTSHLLRGMYDNVDITRENPIA